MNKEKFILIFVAVAMGLLVAVGAFFLYQKTKAISPSKITNIITTSPSPSNKNPNVLTIDNPKDESVVTSASVTVSGKTSPNAKIVIVNQATQESANPTTTGNFSATIGLESGENIIMIIAVFPNGETVSEKRIVTVSSENF